MREDVNSAMSEADDLVDLCGTVDVSPDVPVKAAVDGEDVAVFEVDGQYYVTQDLCTHGPGSLSEGYVEGDEIECPFHQGKFSILTGAPTAAPCMVPLKTWTACVRGDRICVLRK